jgi:glycosyltransferase involved in cell wall biosynthesis
VTSRSPGTDHLEVAIDVSAIPAELSGAGQYTWNVASGLASHATVEVDLLTRRSDRARWEKALPRARLAAVAPDRTGARVLFGEFALGAATARRFPRAQVFFGPHYTMPKHLAIPAVVTIHDLTLVEHPEWHERAKSAYFRRAIAFAARDAAVLICVSERTAQRLQALARPQGDVRVVPHGVDHAHFRPEEPSPGFDAAVAGRLGVSGRFVLHVGTLEPRKNVPGLIAAFDAIAAEHPELSLVLAGVPAWGAKEARAAASVARAAGRIAVLGFVDQADLPSLLRRASAVAYPSFSEGFGLPALEALACGVPLVTSKDTVMADLVGDAGVLVDPHDPNSIAAGLGAALRENGEATSRRARGLEIAAAFSWGRSVEGHLDALRAARR